jgi:3-hydroxyisobutyrate dehydrogenase-like beta-hydroxyacid dehydrogenase
MATIAIISPGGMGQAIGEVLSRSGSHVVTCLHGRGEQTRKRAAAVGMQDLPDYDTLVRASDLILSVLAPASAHSVAELLASAIERTGARPLVADCNAIAPQTTRSIGQLLTKSGARFVDGGIIGPPPKWGASTTRLYLSGKDAQDVVQLAGEGLDIRVVGDQIGQASGLKMCYAALTKGLIALSAEQQIAAAALGLSDSLFQELELSQPALLSFMQRLIPDIPGKAHRFVGEMLEIGATFEAIGVPPGMMLGAAELYRLAAESPVGLEGRHQDAVKRPMESIVQALAKGLTEPNHP